MVAHDSLHRPEVLSSGEVNSMGGSHWPSAVPHTCSLLSRATYLTPDPLTALSPIFCHILTFPETYRATDKQPRSDPKQILSSLVPLKVGMGTWGPLPYFLNYEVDPIVLCPFGAPAMGLARGIA